MDKLKQNIADSISGSIADIWNGSGALSPDEIASVLEVPPDTAMGDLAFPCFRLSRALRMGPPAIASALYERLSLAPPEGISEVTCSGGYLNFRIDDAYLSGTVLGEIAEKGRDFGAHDFGKGKTVVLDYSSPNVAKPFHIGHLGTTVIGHSLKLLHQYAGYTCVGINHLGDWGTQFGKLIVAYRKWGDREQVEKGGVDELVALYVRINNEIKAEEEAGATALADASRAEFTKLEHGDKENLELWKWFKEISLAEYEKTYRQLGITFDSYNGEAFYTDKMPEQVELLREKGLLKLDNGASLVDLSAYNMPPCLILKSDGSTLYPARDIAAAVYRKRTYDFDKCIYVTSAGQSLHFAQWFKVVELMGYDFADKLIHVPYGTVSIGGESSPPGRATSFFCAICSRPLPKNAAASSQKRIRRLKPRTKRQRRSASAPSFSIISSATACVTSTLSWMTRSTSTAIPALMPSTPMRERTASLKKPADLPYRPISPCLIRPRGSLSRRSRSSRKKPRRRLPIWSRPSSRATSSISATLSTASIRNAPSLPARIKTVGIPPDAHARRTRYSRARVGAYLHEASR